MTSEPKTCFIAMPVRTTNEQAAHFGDPAHWEHVMEQLFVPAVVAAGYEVWRPITTGSHVIHAEIVRQLEQADMVLCDISDNNPNVFFELGVRTSINRPIALVRCDASVSIPFDVNGINTHTYDPSLRAWLIEPEKAKLAAHLREAEVSCAGANPMWRQFALEITARTPKADASKDEAMLELVTQRLEELAQLVPGEQPAPWRELDQIGPAILHVARKLGMGDVQVAVGLDGGLMVQLRNTPGFNYRKFRNEVVALLNERGIPLTFARIHVIEYA